MIEFIKMYLKWKNGTHVFVSRGDIGKAWRDEVKGYSLDREPDISGVCYDSAFNDMCKALGLREGF
jgi:hypothetical protein